MLLAIDIGNTKVKCAVFEQDNLLFKQESNQTDALTDCKNILNKYPKIKKSVLSSVANLPENIYLELKKNTELFEISPETLFPFENKYKTPKTLGIDRKVLIAGAVLQFPNQSCLLIDAGTCITYDFVTANKIYFGGAISPGLFMRYQALEQFTAKLPLLSLEYPENFIGNSTNNSIHSGVVNGVLMEIDGFINKYLSENDNLTIILTGGDAVFLAKRLKSTIFANSNFLLESLNSLFQYNKQ